MLSARGVRPGRRLGVLRQWDDGDDGIPDDEVTKDSLAAFDLALRTAKAQEKEKGVKFEFATVGAEMRFKFPEYVAIVRGQSSATAHGRHGSHPDLLIKHRELVEPVWLCYVESGARVYWHGWLHALPPAVPISKTENPRDPNRRDGWIVRRADSKSAWQCQLTRGEGLVFPSVAEIPPPREDLFSGAF